MRRFYQNFIAGASVLCLCSTTSFAQNSGQPAASQSTKRVVLPDDPFATPGSALLFTVSQRGSSCNAGSLPASSTQYYFTVVPPPDDTFSIPTGG